MHRTTKNDVSASVHNYTQLLRHAQNI